MEDILKEENKNTNIIQRKRIQKGYMLLTLSHSIQTNRFLKTFFNLHICSEQQCLLYRII